MHFFSPSHVNLITACYPPSSALVSSGPQYLPNSQELSRLTYYASNHPGKINKLGSELEKRIKAESRKAQAGNTRSKASLLIGLSIFHSLTNECRRDVSLLSPSLIASITATLAALSSDLEVAARTANVFAAWATYTDGHLIGVDNEVTQNYMLTLRAFSSLGSVETKDKDHEFRNRTRLVGLGALASAVNSEVLYNASSHFKAQVSIVVRPILVTLLQSDVAVLEKQSTSVKDKLKSTYLAEFRTRPPIERRAASIHVHVDGDNGPATTEVINECLRTLSSLLQHANGWQLGQIMQAVADSLDELKGWKSLEQCRWLARKTCEWTQYQYRYAVPTRLVERLLESQDLPSTNALQSSLAAMVTTVFTSSIPLINLSTSDIISNLMTLILHRIVVNSEDALLPELVECISSLGTHVYYSDQIQDLAGELVARLVSVELQGVTGSTLESSKKSRSQAIRCLLAGLLGLMQAADKDGRVHGDIDDAKERSRITSGPVPPPSPSIGTVTTQDPHSRPSRRTRVSPEIWLDTLSLLCDADYAIRADYAEAFVFYLQTEIRKRGDSTDADGVKRIRPLAEGPIQQATQMKLLSHGDPAMRALNAAHGYIYVLATASSLGFDPSTQASSAPTEYPSVTLTPSTPLTEEPSSSDAPENQDSPPQSQRQGRRSTTSTPRKASVMQRALEAAPSRVSTSTAATASDYAHILVMLTAMHEQLPVRGLLTGIPLLLALDGATQVTNSVDLATIVRLWTIKEVLARAWCVVGKVWDCPELITLAEEALANMPGPSNLPPVSLAKTSSLRPAPEPVLFIAAETKPASLWSGLSSQSALMSIISNQSVQEATGLDRPGLLRRFSAKWTAESALRESIERPSNYDTLRGDGISPLLKISPALMNIDNVSLQSLARSTRGVGVTDLREALEGRSSMSNPALAKAPSISTLDHAPSAGDHHHRGHRSNRSVSSTKKRKTNATGSDDVRDVLNKLGLGRQNGSSLLKASFPTLQKADQRSPSNLLPFRT